MKQALMDHLEILTEAETALTERFYEILFERYPAVRGMFGRRSQEAQGRMLQESIVAVVQHLDNDAWLKDHLRVLGRAHLDYGVTREMYGWVAECLLQALADLSKEQWTLELADVWRSVLGQIVLIMLEGADEAAERAPERSETVSGGVITAIS
jgi:hemoglobin-like flavoprotein